MLAPPRDAMPLVDRIRLGKSGEDVACRELRRRGYAILARRYRTRIGEIDIVARDGETIVFVEVKTRTTTAFGAPGEAVGPRKQHKIWLMGSDYLLRHGWQDRPCRFDVVAISTDEQGRRQVEVFESRVGRRPALAATRRWCGRWRPTATRWSITA